MTDSTPTTDDTELEYEWTPEPYDRTRERMGQWVRRQINSNRAAAQEFGEDFASEPSDGT